MSDLISRQAAIDAVGKYLKKDGDVITIADVVDAAVAIGMLPAAEPERKKPDHGYMWICPECGLEVHSDFSRCVRCGWDRPSAEREKGRWLDDHGNEKKDGYGADCSVCGCWSEYLTDFCGSCGADMRGTT